MFLSRNKKNNVYPCKPQFYYIKVGFKGVKIILACFRDEILDQPPYNGSNPLRTKILKLFIPLHIFLRPIMTLTLTNVYT